ncbi:MAG: hypothetical protein U0228_05255 [Myxococcaceae bacterium]
MLTALLSVLLVSGPLVTETKCEGFSLVVTSPSGVPTEDDGRLEIVVGGKRLPVKLAPAMFTFADEHPSFHAPAPRCPTGAAAHELTSNLVLVVLTRSGRPGLDRLSFVLVDLKRREIVEAIDTPYELASARTSTGDAFRIVTRANGGGLDLRAVREWLPGDDSIDGAMEDWLAVRLSPVGRALDVKWLRR